MQYVRDKGRISIESLTLASVCATDYLCGVAGVSYEMDGWARPQRFGERQRRALASCLAWHPGQFRQMATTTAGVCLRLATDASNMAIAARIDDEPPATKATLKGLRDAPHDGFSLEVDGREMGLLVPEDGLLAFSLVDSTKEPANGMAALPGLGKRHEVCLWLPCLSGCAIRELWADGSYVEPLASRPRLLVLGDELGQGYCSGDPACAWPVLYARKAGMELHNQSVTGQVFQPSSILDTGIGRVEQVIVELGGNYLLERCDARSVAADIRGFFLEALRQWPDAHICAILPTWYGSSGGMVEGSCFASVPRLIMDAARERNVDVVDGRPLVGEGLCVLPSGAEVLDRRGNQRFATRLAIALSQAGLLQDDLRARALGLLARSAPCALPMAEVIRRGLGEVLIACEGCVMVRTPDQGCMLFASDSGLALDVCGSVPGPSYLNVLGTGLAEPVGAEMGLDRCEPYHLCVYEQTKPLPTDPRLVSCIRALDKTYANEVFEHYTHSEWLSRRLLAEALAKGRFIGAFVEEELVGFVGEHPEGSIGMLEVFDGHQREGWGAALMAAKVNDHLSRGEMPWSEVYPQNKASLRLHRKLGFTVMPFAQAGYLSRGVPN